MPVPPPVYLVRDERVTTIKPDGLVLGYQENQEYEEVIIDIHSNETLVMFTDGLYIHGRDRNQFSESEFIRTIQDSRNLENHKALLENVLTATGQESWNDDVTLLTVKVL